MSRNISISTGPLVTVEAGQGTKIFIFQVDLFVFCFYVLCMFQLCHKFPSLIIANRQPYTGAQSETMVFVEAAR